MNESTIFKTDVKTAVSIVFVVGAAVWAWASLKTEVASHTDQLQAIQTTMRADHDVLKVQGTLIEGQGLLLERMDRKLDRISTHP